ncbi:glycosyltransferase family 4 protein [Tellurirhabdus bombi]|uniref:glycosyltransferase family 4 protein n=1 Tax=Tellurirhabdus bombi TaxID=2907205 RepID=UPI001F2B46E8|nr:glycosyltransferase family 4 protein [Tellurirhabdus bombi]
MARKLNILQLSTYHTSGGAGIAARRLNEALVRAGQNSWMLVPQTDRPEPHVAGLAETTLERKMAFARFALDRLSFWPYEKSKAERFAFSPARVGTDISRHPLVQQADILHLHWTQFGFLGLSDMSKLFRLGKPVVWTLHDMWAFTGGCHYSRGCAHYQTHCHHCPFLRNPGAHDLSYRLFEKKVELYHNAPLTFVTPSKWLSKSLKVSHLGQPFPVHVLPNPIDSNRFQPAQDRQVVRRQLGLPLDKKLLLFGSFNTQDPRKGFRYIQEALQLQKDRLPDTEIVIFGKSNPEIVNALPLPVTNLGSITSEEKMIAVYQAADVLLIPSLEDNFPNTIIESLACGTPVLGFRTGGIPEQIMHRQTGYLAQLASAEDLAQGLHWLLTQADLPIMRQNAARHIHSWLSYEAMASEFTELYQNLLKA